MHTPLRTLVVPCALKSPFATVELSEAWRKSPVHPKKPRKILFEPTASERDLDEEGNWQLPGLFYRSCLSNLSVLLDNNFPVRFSVYLQGKMSLSVLACEVRRTAPS